MTTISCRVILGICLFATLPMLAEEVDLELTATGDIHSMTLRTDGRYDVICRDNSHEVASAEEVQNGNVCLKKESNFLGHYRRFTDSNQIFGGQYFYLMKIKVTRNTELKNFGVIIRSLEKAKQGRFAIYDSDHAGLPTRLLVASDKFTLKEGRNEVSARSTSLKPGTYWLSWNFDNLIGIVSTTSKSTEMSNLYSAYYLDMNFDIDYPTTLDHPLLMRTFYTATIAWNVYVTRD